jgi:signal transduction histidine kinase
MRSLRANLILGAWLWTFGLLSAWSVVITKYGPAWAPLRVVHLHGHVMLALAIITTIAGLVVVRAALAPFMALRRGLADVQRGARRQLSGTYPAEVQPLVNDLNALLAHHEIAVSRALGKAGDLAHGLKTPLAVLAQEAERAAAAGHADLAAVVTEQVERMRRQVEYHLAHARAAASGATPGARCSVVDSAEPLARTLLRLHAGRGVTIAVHVDAAHAVRSQRADLDEMLGNLLDNACKWAKSRVEITSAILPPTRPADGGGHESIVAIAVDDDGPGLDSSMREAVLQRGVRADEAAPGSGFGLAIVREIARLYGGSIALETSPLGGLRASLRLPVAPR